MRLRVGHGPIGKFFVVLICGVIIAVALAFAGFVPGLLDGGPDTSEFPGAVFAIAFTVIPAFIAVIAFLGAWHALRYGAWLDGAVVSVRGMVSTRRVDLAAAYRFWFDERRETRSSGEFHTTYFTPLLCAQDRHGQTKIPLGYYGRR
ncbi:MAG: hypothetical protein GEU94_21230, partial [Micromonosporaceae bacterium]|nr:hypothetical protein [Micromonosporaceae bacterium]